MGKNPVGELLYSDFSGKLGRMLSRQPDNPLLYHFL